jgi:hypothetical protein
MTIFPHAINALMIHEYIKKRKKERERLENRYLVKIDFYRSFYQEKHGTVPEGSIKNQKRKEGL